MTPLSDAAERVSQRWGDAASTNVKDQEAVLERVLERFDRWDWQHATMREVAAAARASFLPNWTKEARLDQLRAFFLAELPYSEPQFRIALLDAYLDGFSPTCRWIELLSEVLSKTELPARAGRLKQAVTDLLNLRDAPRSVARIMNGSDGPASELKAISMPRARSSGLMRHAHLEYLKIIADRLEEREVSERLLNWLEGPAQTPLQVGAAQAITALIAPWSGSRTRDADANTITRLTRRLVDLYRDPRIHKGEPWRSVGEAERILFERWLAGENLRLLFDAVSLAAQNSDEIRMWEQRREFYLGLHKQGRIDAAWVAFADQGAREARRILARAGTSSRMSFGMQTDGGGRANTSIMILKIGSKIIVDGSHSYKVHVFDASSPGAPSLYANRYSCEDIRLSPHHTGAKPHLGDWQSWVLQRV